ncbi:hypothetical protein [Oceanobacillus sp. J11TS1]|nr:hypothetical protein [Oceanobacillus sp. J11TS1]GIO24324.1 hypothetical protein J11TS1_29050 [Oceanobacillus sp. J11TS1]
MTSLHEVVTRKVWVIENIIKDQVGYYSSKVNDTYLVGFIDRIKRSEEKK